MLRHLLILLIITCVSIRLIHCVNYVHVKFITFDTLRLTLKAYIFIYICTQYLYELEVNITYNLSTIYEKLLKVEHQENQNHNLTSLSIIWQITT